ncbi:MAG TPA: transglutaminase-like domain-containing protein [Steroidobacteraceae bacterium]|nr:transglutaminase-like domain-containing protein [Steroidobacteraceae bacterium]
MRSCRAYRSNRRATAILPIGLLAAACSFAAPAAGPARVTADMPLADFARTATGEEFYGAYLFGHKVGWISDRSRMASYQGTPVFEDETEIHMEVQVSGQRSRKILLSTVRYSLQGDGEIVSIVEDDTEDDSQVQRSAVRDGDSLRITSREKNGRTSQRLVPMPRRDTLQSARDAEVWLAGKRRKGDRFPGYEVDLSAEKIESETIMEYLAPNPLVWGGVPLDASRVKMHVEGLDFTALVAPDGKMLRGKMAGLVEIRAEEEQVARATDGKALDMLAASSIAVAAPLGDRDTINGLTLEISGLGDFHLPASPRQRVRQTGKGREMVELRRESTQPAAAPLTPQQRAQFLRATPSVQSDAPEILALARQIAGDETDPVRIAGRIVDWIDRNLQSAYGADALTATAVLAQKRGDCTEHTLLFTALARAAGVPTRQLGGIIYVDDPAPLFGWHAWAEIHDGRGWISVDPTWHQLRVDPTHVQFSFSGDDLDSDDMGWVQAMGSVKIAVKKVDRRG